MASVSADGRVSEAASGSARCVLDDAIEAMLSIGPQGRIKYFNRSAERLFGYRAYEVLDSHLSLLFPSPGREVIEAYVASCLSEPNRTVAGIGRPAEGIRSDGGIFPLRLLASPVQLDRGTFTGFVRDESNELRLIDNLAQSHRLLRSISRAQALVIGRRASHVVFSELLNILLEETDSAFGFIAETQTTPSGIPFLRSLAISDISWDESTRGLYRSVPAGGMEFHNLDTLFGAVITGRRAVISNEPETDRRGGGTPPGHPRLTSFMGLPLFYDEQLVGMVGMGNRPGGYRHELAHFLDPLLGVCAQSIEFRRRENSRQEAEKELRDAKECAEAASHASREFLANVSHEIRTPLTAIIGFADVLLDKNQEPDLVEAAATIRNSGRHLVELVNQLLDLAKIEAGKLELEFVRCPLREIVDEVAALMRIRVEEKHLSLEVHVDEGARETIITDPMRLRQVLINLLNNALKFTDQGEVKLAVHTVPDRRDRLQFVIKDDGIGMTPEQIEKLFQPFEQAERSTARRFGGTGLGLAISSRIVELLGGEIDVDSEPGRGSTFTATIAVEHAVTNDYRSDEAPETGEEPNEPTAPNLLAGRRLLLAEDGPDNRRIIAWFLNKAGAEVVEAENGRQAVEAVLAARDAGRDFDAILMDVQMPEMDGCEAVIQLRQREGYTGPIIALTAHAMAEHRRHCLDAGYDDYASKPIEQYLLVRMVHRYVVRGPSGPRR